MQIHLPKDAVVSFGDSESMVKVEIAEEQAVDIVRCRYYETIKELADELVGSLRCLLKVSGFEKLPELGAFLTDIEEVAWVSPYCNYKEYAARCLLASWSRNAYFEDGFEVAGDTTPPDFYTIAFYAIRKDLYFELDGRTVFFPNSNGSLGFILDLKDPHLAVTQELLNILREEYGS